MAVTLKTTGIAAQLINCIAVNPQTGVLQDFASATITSTMVVDADLVITDDTWKGVTRKKITLSTGNHIQFGANKPSFSIAAAASGTGVTYVWIGIAAGNDTFVVGADSNRYFAARLTNGGTVSPAIKNFNGSQGSGARITAGKAMFGASILPGTSTRLFSAQESAADLTIAAGSLTMPGSAGAFDVPVEYLMRSTNTEQPQEPSSLFAYLKFSAALTDEQVQALHDDWFGELFDVIVEADTTPPALTGNITVTGLTSTGYTATCPAATDAGGVTGYEYRINAGAWTAIAAGGRVATITGRTAGTADALEMRAFDAAPNYSVALSASVDLPAVVTDTTEPTQSGAITIGTVTSTSIQMSWPAGADNVGVAGYDVSSNSGSMWTTLGNVLTHTFSGLSPSTTYELRVRPRDAAGNVDSTPLAVAQATGASGGGDTAPAITSQPSAQTVPAGAAATFTAAASGSPAPTLQWQRSTNSGGTWAAISGATAASYTTPVATVSGGAANSGDQYRAVATNSAGSATSAAATLTVTAAAPAPAPAPAPATTAAPILIALDPLNGRLIQLL